MVTTVDPSLLSVQRGRAAIADEVVAWTGERYRPCALALFTSRAGARAFLGAEDKLAALLELREERDLIALGDTVDDVLGPVRRGSAPSPAGRVAR